jgi:glycosyltransferase involved in cell wall biosynthesis
MAAATLARRRDFCGATVSITSEKDVRILLIAYEFPPGRSPRALRWRYLVRELALLGHDVHVLAPDLGDPGVVFPSAPGGVHLHRVFAGPLATLLRARKRPVSDGTGSSGPQPTTTAQLNRKGQFAAWLKRGVALLLYPDARAEWSPWARVAMDRLLVSLNPDVVVTSHEPASTLPLGRRARRKGFAWVADLGDPVCAPYTPSRWRRRAKSLETAVAAEADAVLVPNEAARRLLVRRHASLAQRCMVLSQGYDDRHETGSDCASSSAGATDRLELLYTGRLYRFRNPTNLLRALGRVDGVRLTMVLADPPTDGMLDGMDQDGRLRVLGPRRHAEVLALQQQADVLVSLGNRGMPEQVPGKVFEYLGTRKPILHISTGEDDTAAGILGQFRRGWQCADDDRAIEVLIRGLRQRQQAGCLAEGLQLAPEPAYAMSVLGQRLSDMLAVAVGGARRHARGKDHANHHGASTDGR